MNKWWKFSTSPELTILILFVLGIELDIIYNITSDFQQGNVYKIIYIHVPLAWITLQNYALLIIICFIYMIRKERMYEIYIKTLNNISIICGTLTIVTGSIWGKPTWGTYWVFDVRLTSMLILVIIVLINLVILTISRSKNIFYFSTIEKEELVSDNTENTYNTEKYENSINKYIVFQNKGNIYKWISIVTIIGGINLPIVKYSVDWWSSLHQKSTISITKISIDYNTAIPILIGWFLLSLILIKFITKNWNLNYKNLFIIKYKTKGILN